MNQTDKLYILLSDGMEHSTFEIAEKIYGLSEGPHVARIGARVYDVKKAYKVEIDSRSDKINKKMWWYRLIPKPIEGELFTVSAKSVSPWD